MGDLLPRGFRFSHKDKNLLTNLVSVFPAIMYKGLDAESLSKKMIAWEDLTRQFNASSTNDHEFTFTPRHLKALWKRMKLQSKKAAAAQESSSTSTANTVPVPEVSRLNTLPKNDPDYKPCSEEDYTSPHTIKEELDPEDSQNSIVFPSCTVDIEIGEEFNLPSSPPATTPPNSREFFSSYLNNGERLKRKRPIQVEMDHLLEEHQLRMDCLRLDREVKILKKWKIQQEILSAGFDLPPANFC